MALQNFVDKVGPPINSAWLNQIDVLANTVFGGAQTNPAARAALCLDLPLEIINGGTGARTAAAALSNLGGLSSGGVGASIWPINAAESLAGITSSTPGLNLNYPWYWVTRYGALGNAVANDLPAFNLAAAVAIYSGIVIIPSSSPTYYKLVGTWNLIGLPPGAIIMGAGLSSILVIASGGAANCITNNGNIHLQFMNFGIYGTAGSGNGIENINSAHYPDHTNIWVGFVGGACFKTTLGICARYDHCQADDNNAFRPVHLIGGLTEGTPQYGFYIASDPGDNNNDPTFIDCRANAVGGTCSVKIGDHGGVPITGAHWYGGLIQGSSAFTEIYMVATDSTIDAYIEPLGGNTVGWIATLDACTNVKIHNTTLQGDMRLINNCANCGVEHITGAGVSIVGGLNNFVRDMSYNNISTGPGAGQIIDTGVQTDLYRLSNGANVLYAAGNNVRTGTTYFQSNMQEWVGGGSPSVPCGFGILGAPTITQDATVYRTGAYSCKVQMGGSFTSGFGIGLGPIDEIAGHQIYVEAWVYNQGSAGLAYLQGVEGGTGFSYQQASYQVGLWERMSVTFAPSAGATSFTLFFTGLAGTVNWNSTKIMCEEHTALNELLIDGTATPDIAYPLGGYGGYPVKRILVPASGTAFASVLNPHIGFDYDFIWQGIRTLTNGVQFATTSAGNINGVAGTTARFNYGSDGMMRQV